MVSLFVQDFSGGRKREKAEARRHVERARLALHYYMYVLGDFLARSSKRGKREEREGRESETDSKLMRYK